MTRLGGTSLDKMTVAVVAAAVLQVVVRLVFVIAVACWMNAELADADPDSGDRPVVGNWTSEGWELTIHGMYPGFTFEDRCLDASEEICVFTSFMVVATVRNTRPETAVFEPSNLKLKTEQGAFLPTSGSPALFEKAEPEEEIYGVASFGTPTLDGAKLRFSGCCGLAGFEIPVRF